MTEKVSNKGGLTTIWELKIFPFAVDRIAFQEYRRAGRIPSPWPDLLPEWRLTVVFDGLRNALHSAACPVATDQDYSIIVKLLKSPNRVILGASEQNPFNHDMRSSSAILEDVGAYPGPDSCGLGLCPSIKHGSIVVSPEIGWRGQGGRRPGCRSFRCRDSGPCDSRTGIWETGTLARPWRGSRRAVVCA